MKTESKQAGGTLGSRFHFVPGWAKHVQTYKLRPHPSFCLFVCGFLVFLFVFS